MKFSESISFNGFPVIIITLILLFYASLCQGSLAERPGDLNGDSKITLADTILALKVSTGIEHSLMLNGFDINDDQRIGLAEAVFNLQIVANIRSDIHFWYGQDQIFGSKGIPQKWINVLGNVSNPYFDSLSYSLNGGNEIAIPVGPDGRRLEASGDFNVEIDFDDIVAGQNTIEILAVYDGNMELNKTATINYEVDQKWPMPYLIDWGNVSNIQDVAQIVDGNWKIENDQLTVHESGYDRLVAIGDVSWTDYEVTVPITVQEINKNGSVSPPGVGILMRWDGHKGDSKPRNDWYPCGALGVYGYNADSDEGSLKIVGGGTDLNISDDSGFTLEYNKTYIFKMRVETIPSIGSLYRLKVWEKGDSEPSGWQLEGMEDLSDPLNGSLLLVAHHLIASFGNLVINPIIDNEGPKITEISTSEFGTWVIMYWSTDEPSTSKVKYGFSQEYELGFQEDDILKTQHQILLPQLESNAIYHAKIVSIDGWGNINESNDIVIETKEPNLTQIAIEDISVSQGHNKATIKWTTNVPSTSSVLYGNTTSYEKGRIDSEEYVLEHQIELDGLERGVIYHLQIRSMDGSKEIAKSADIEINTGNPSGIISDGFNDSEINSSLWEFINPLDDGNLTMTGERLSISIPGNEKHDIWDDGVTVPRIMQPAMDSDFEVEAKFNSKVEEQYQTQGIFIEGTGNNYIRLEIHSDGSSVKAFSANFINGELNMRKTTVLSDNANFPYYVRVRRDGSTWLYSYSHDGNEWIDVSNFDFFMELRFIGLYVGNAGSSPPPHTVLVDYFLNNDSPL